MVLTIFVVTLIFGWEEWWTILDHSYHTYNSYLAGKSDHSYQTYNSYLERVVDEEERYLLSSAVSYVCSVFAPEWNNKEIFKGRGN